MLLSNVNIECLLPTQSGPFAGSNEPNELLALAVEAPWGKA